MDRPIKYINTTALTIILLAALAFAMILSILFGAVYVKPIDAINTIYMYLKQLPMLDTSTHYIIMEVRIPRILLTALAGAILSLVGVLMQTITQNPLAEPYVLGISSGASAGAVSAIVLGWFSVFSAGHVYVGAFIGSLVATVIVIMLQSGSSSTVRLVLVGMGVSAFFQAITTMIIYSSSNEAQVRSAMFWTVGSFSSVLWTDILLPFGVFIALLIFCFVIAKELDLLLLGQRTAAQMGLNVKRFQLAVVIMASASVAIVVAKVGVIGFVGLIVPHIMRRISGVRHCVLIMHTALCGALFLVMTDTIARTAFAPQEVPIGVITALIGAPVFIIIIKRTDYGSKH